MIKVDVDRGRLDENAAFLGKEGGRDVLRRSIAELADRQFEPLEIYPLARIKEKRANYRCAHQAICRTLSDSRIGPNARACCDGRCLFSLATVSAGTGTACSHAFKGELADSSPDPILAGTNCCKGLTASWYCTKITAAASL